MHQARGNLQDTYAGGKVKETNRKAQRRYRDRQREKLAAAEDRVAELTDQLSRLRTEKVREFTFPLLGGLVCTVECA